MPLDVFAKLAEHGPLGIACLALGWYVVRLSQKLTDVQDKRVDDAKAYASLAERIAEQNSSAMIAMRSASDGMVDALARVEDALRRK